MASKNPIFHYFIIIAFASGIVAIGIHDVNRDFQLSPSVKTTSAKNRSAAPTKRLVDELRGENQFRARGSVNRPEERPKVASSSKPTFFERLLGGKRGATGEPEGKARDELERGDREELDSLLNSVWANDTGL